MNSESWADATLVGVAFGSHWGPSQSPGKVWPKQLQPKTLYHPYFKGCVYVVMTWSLSQRLAFCIIQGKSGVMSFTSWGSSVKGSPLAVTLFQWPTMWRESSKKETWQSAGKGTHSHPEHHWHQTGGRYRAHKQVQPRVSPPMFFRQYSIEGGALGHKWREVWFPDFTYLSTPQLGPCLRSYRVSVCSEIWEVFLVA